MSLVKWVDKDDLQKYRHNVSQFLGEPQAVPVVELAALTEVVKGLKDTEEFLLQNKGVCWNGPQDRALYCLRNAQRLLTQLEGHTT